MKKIFIFLDESWLSGNRYWGLGMIISDADILEKVEYQLNQIIAHPAEVKWDKIRTREWAWKYKCIVNLFMNYEMYFSALIVDSHVITKKTLMEYHEGDKNLLFYKLHRYFISNRLRTLKEKDIIQAPKTLRIMLDYRTVKNIRQYLEDLDNLLFKDLIDLFPERHDIQLEPTMMIDSKLSRLLQLTDILLGATVYKWNFPDLSRSEKVRDFILYLEKTLNIKLDVESTLENQKFNIWLWKPRS